MTDDYKFGYESGLLEAYATVQKISTKIAKDKLRLARYSTDRLNDVQLILDLQDAINNEMLEVVGDD